MTHLVRLISCQCLACPEASSYVSFHCLLRLTGAQGDLAVERDLAGHVVAKDKFPQLWIAMIGLVNIAKSSGHPGPGRRALCLKTIAGKAGNR